MVIEPPTRVTRADQANPDCQNQGRAVALTFDLGEEFRTRDEPEASGTKLGEEEDECLEGSTALVLNISMTDLSIVGQDDVSTPSDIAGGRLSGIGWRHPESAHVWPLYPS